MCGRFSLSLSPDIIRATFRYVEQPNFPPRYNIAPTQPIAVVRMNHAQTPQPQRHFALLRWGFLPAFVKDLKDFPLIINARAETLRDKPSFKHAFKRRRCIIIADAFYEWQRQGKIALPYLFRRRDGAPLALGGVWETWCGPNGEETDSACIVTTTANAVMAPVHHRMPVILQADEFDVWLDADSYGVDDALALTRPAGDDVLECFRVSPMLNRASYDAADLHHPIDADPVPPAPQTALKTKAKRKAAAPSQGDLF
jgi:putative SOS response-associated peptidase YedK